MNTDKEELYAEVEGKPVYDEYLPDPIQALIDWIILLITTLVSFFNDR